MSDEPFALSPVPPSPPTQGDYEAICTAVMNSVRGRWFLQEYAKRNRNADTRSVLAAIERIEAVIRGDQAQHAQQSFRSDLLEMARAIAQTRAQVAEIEAGAPQEQAAESGSHAPPDVFSTAGRLHDIARTMRERGVEPDTCEQVQALASTILAASSLRDPSDGRAQRLGEVLRYLERRIDTMLAACAESVQTAAEANHDAVDAAHPDPAPPDDHPLPVNVLPARGRSLDAEVAAPAAAFESGSEAHIEPERAFDAAPQSPGEARFVPTEILVEPLVVTVAQFEPVTETPAPEIELETVVAGIPFTPTVVAPEPHASPVAEQAESIAAMPAAPSPMDVAAGETEPLAMAPEPLLAETAADRSAEAIAAYVIAIETAPSAPAAAAGEPVAPPAVETPAAPPSETSIEFDYEARDDDSPLAPVRAEPSAEVEQEARELQIEPLVPAAASLPLEQDDRSATIELEPLTVEPPLLDPPPAAAETAKPKSALPLTIAPLAVDDAAGAPHQPPAQDAPVVGHAAPGIVANAPDVAPAEITAVIAAAIAVSQTEMDFPVDSQVQSDPQSLASLPAEPQDSIAASEQPQANESPELQAPPKHPEPPPETDVLSSAWEVAVTRPVAGSESTAVDASANAAAKAGAEARQEARIRIGLTDAVAPKREPDGVPSMWVAPPTAAFDAPPQPAPADFLLEPMPLPEQPAAPQPVEFADASISQPAPALFDSEIEDELFADGPAALADAPAPAPTVSSPPAPAAASAPSAADAAAAPATLEIPSVPAAAGAPVHTAAQSRPAVRPMPRAEPADPLAALRAMSDEERIALFT